jgi:hypothetical protein
MFTRQDVLDAAYASLAAWGYHDPQVVQDVSSARLQPGAAYSTHWFVQVRVRKGTDTHSPSVSVRLIVQEASGRLMGRDFEESNTPFPVPWFRPAKSVRLREGSPRATRLAS